MIEIENYLESLGNDLELYQNDIQHIMGFFKKYFEEEEILDIIFTLKKELYLFTKNFIVYTNINEMPESVVGRDEIEDKNLRIINRNFPMKRINLIRNKKGEKENIILKVLFVNGEELIFNLHLIKNIKKIRKMLSSFF